MKNQMLLILSMVILTSLASACSPQTINNPNMSSQVKEAGTRQTHDSSGVPDYSNGFAVNGWAGKIIELPSDSHYDDYLLFESGEDISVGLVGSNLELDSQIMALRNSNKTFHFWGLLTCNEKTTDYNYCQLVVTRLSPSSINNHNHTGNIDGWTGKMTRLANSAPGIFYFMLSGEMPVKFNITSQVPEMNAQLENYYKSEAVVRLWGSLYSTAPDAGYVQIEVSKIENVKDETSIPFAATSLPKKIAPSSQTGWHAYTNDDIGFSLLHPSSAIIKETNADFIKNKDIFIGLDSDENITQTQALSNNPFVCVEIEYDLGYIAITSTTNLKNKYISCGHTVKGIGTLIGKQEEISIAGKQQIFEGFEFIPSSNIRDHHEIFNTRLPGNINVQFGTSEIDKDAYLKYLETTKSVIYEILTSLSTQ